MLLCAPRTIAMAPGADEPAEPPPAAGPQAAVAVSAAIESPPSSDRYRTVDRITDVLSMCAAQRREGRSDADRTTKLYTNEEARPRSARRSPVRRTPRRG